MAYASPQPVYNMVQGSLKTLFYVMYDREYKPREDLQDATEAVYVLQDKDQQNVWEGTLSNGDIVLGEEGTVEITIPSCEQFSGSGEEIAVDFDNSPAVDMGGGNVQIPCTDHPFRSGATIVIQNTVNYNGIHVIQSVTDDAFVLQTAYVAETFPGGGEEVVVSFDQHVPIRIPTGYLGIVITDQPFQEGKSITVRNTIGYDGTYIIQNTETDRIDIDKTLQVDSLFPVGLYEGAIEFTFPAGQEEYRLAKVRVEKEMIND